MKKHQVAMDTAHTTHAARTLVNRRLVATNTAHTQQTKGADQWKAAKWQ